jgi:chorismate synthase
MPGSSFGHALRVTTFGESHGVAVGCVVDGCPAGVPLDAARISAWLARRRPGQGPHTSARAEADEPRILSGVYQGRTLGTPIAVMVENTDAKSQDYAGLDDVFRPGHADFTWHARYGHRDPRGGGRASARETVGRVAAGAVAEAVLEALATASRRPPVRIVAWVQQMGSVTADSPEPSELTSQRPVRVDHAIDPWTLTREQVDASPVRCPDAAASERMLTVLEEARRDRDSLGGIIRCVVLGVPAGWGDPVFDKLSGSLAHALGSLPAVKGIAFGSGFAAASMRGSEHNDPFLRENSGAVGTATNHAGGLLGGISTGMPLVIDVAFKPVATIPQPQQAIGPEGPPRATTVTGRHDPCVLPRAVAIVEAAVALVLADHALRPARIEAIAGPEGT